MHLQWQMRLSRGCYCARIHAQPLPNCQSMVVRRGMRKGAKEKETYIHPRHLQGEWPRPFSLLHAPFSLHVLSVSIPISIAIALSRASILWSLLSWGGHSMMPPAKEKRNIRCHCRGIVMRHMDRSFVVRSGIHHYTGLLASRRCEMKFDIDLRWVVDIHCRCPLMVV